MAHGCPTIPTVVDLQSTAGSGSLAMEVGDRLMTPFTSIKDLLNTLVRGKALLGEMFEKRKSLSYKVEYATEILAGDEGVLQVLLNKQVVRQNGAYLELEDQFLQFFEQVLEVNEELNIAYVDEHIRQVRDEYMLYYLQANGEAERYKYLKAVKGALRKIDLVTQRNVIDLNRNIEHAFKTEPNYKIKLLKLENLKTKLVAIQSLIEQTERLVTEDELTFFKAANDDELKVVVLLLQLHLTEGRQNLIEIRKQIIEYINQVKYQSTFIEHLRQVKYLKDQFELKAKTNIVEVVQQNAALALQSKPSYPLKLSLDGLQGDAAYALIQKVNARMGRRNPASVSKADAIAAEYLVQELEENVPIDLMALKNAFAASGRHLWDFVMQYEFSRPVEFPERVTVYCQVIALYEEELEILERFGRQADVEFAVVYPKVS